MSETKAAGVTAQLIDDLLASGTPVDEGQFTIDGAAAARKMEAFRYVDHERYLVPLVEALHRLDCREIAIEREGEDLVLRAANVSLDDVEETLLDIYSHAIGDNASEALGRLAIAMDMALSDPGNQRIALTYSNAAHSYAAVYRAREAPSLVHDHPKVIRELRLFIDRPWRDRLVGDPEKVLGHLREAVRYSSRVVTIDGELVSQQPREWLTAREGEGPGFRLRFVEAPTSQGSFAELWAAGLLLDTIDLDGRGVHAVIELDAPKRDLSQMQIIRDACVEAAVAMIEELRPAKSDEPDEASDEPPKSLKAIMQERRAKSRRQDSEDSTASEDSDGSGRRPVARAHDDSDAHEAPTKRGEAKNTGFGWLIWAFGLISGTKMLAVVIGQHDDESVLTVMASELSAFLILGGIILFGAGWTFGWSYFGASIVLGDKQPTKVAGLASMIFAIVVAISLPGGCA